MISALHIILNTYDADAARGFFRDILGMEFVDAGEGWLIFAMPPSELACHPGAEEVAGESEGGSELYLMCKDIVETRAELETKGIEFVEAIADHGYGLVTHLKVPGYGTVGLYEPHHPSPLAGFR